MEPGPDTFVSRHRPWVRGVVGVVGMLAVVYGFWAAYLALMADEGALPPTSRIPDVPASAHTVSDTTQCASGGCWRELQLRPADGQSAERLATEMGVAAETRHGWQPLDPHSVTVGSTVRDGRLSVYVRY